MESQFSTEQPTCTDCNQPRPLEYFLKNDKINKTCSTCRDRRNRQNAQKRAVADTLADASIVHITIEDFFKTLKTMKDRTIENFKQIIDISRYATPINPKEIASHISDNILTAINFKFKYHCAQLLDRQKKSKKHEDPTKHRDRLPIQQFHCRGWLMLTVDIEKLQVTTELTHEYHAEYIDSAIKIIEQYDDIEILLTVEDSGVTMISFGVMDIINQLGVNVVKIGIDATFKRYRSPSFWRHKNLIPLVQGLEPVEENETYELEEEIDIDMLVENEESNEADEDLVEQLNNETYDELVDALEEYEGENDDFFEEVDESWEEVNNRVTQKLQQ
ncbi:14083_t:CDS:2 [Racocetra persica]|uniref:14083_t:CDS:1 n=1 Tax=Racocetra persica TaxID=160502 RepID=A0ACA9NDP1_9GLOM|nr:14083_t:CDS:2 [Racocetra persica]